MQEKVNDWNAIEEIDEETIRLREKSTFNTKALQQVVRLVTFTELMFANQR